MDGNLSGEESDIDWDTEDELEIQGPPSPPVPPVEEPETGNGDMNWNSDDDLEIEAMPLYMPPPSSPPEQKPKILNGEASTSTAPSNYMLIKRFVSMGFSEELVTKAIKENGEEASDDVITDFLLTYNAIESSPQNQQTRAISDPSLSESDGENIDFDYFSDSDSWPGTEENGTSLNDEEKRVKSLEKMGYTKEESELALQRCGLEASLSELTDFICAAQLARADDVNWQEDVKPNVHRNGILKKRKLCEYERKKEKKRQQVEGVELIRLPKPMIGFGIPKELTPRDEIIPIKHNRILPEHIRGPPYFYYENVALAPKGVWDTISRSLYDIEPEFVDSKYFCAAARKRGYIHNLPITGRRPLLPFPPRTIHEALPLTKRWWPKWDTRTKLNCLQTAIGSAKLTDRIRKAVEGHDVPPVAAQKFVIEQCRKWNLVWVGPNKVAPLECDEFELLLGFPKNHTRGGGISRTDRYKSLGNSFQVDTVAYHLSVLKEIFPKGINLLSLFSGIGGAEVALHRLGVPLKNVVSVEKSEQNRDIVRSWWEQTNQRGTLTHYDDVQMLNKETLEHHIRNFGGFDLVIGGSPCNNLAGSNRVSRDGLEGEHSSLFYHYPRILDLVRSIMNGVNR